MKNEILSDLKPTEFFHWFEVVSKIPRGSGNEQGMIDFLRQFADERELSWDVDAAGNVLMTVPATEGYEQEPPVLFQAHMDIVCAKEADVDFDFEKEPIRMVIKGDRICAEGTTLGADNAVGLATMLALADAQDIPHPELELLFTVEEEVGLQGIRKFDLKRIRSRRMINMDCGDSHVVCVSSAGRIAAVIDRHFETKPVPAEFASMEIAVTGGIGGHNGIMINKGRACAGNLIGDLLVPLADLPVQLCAIRSGETAILKECSAVIALPRDLAGAAQTSLTERFEKIRKIYERTDPDLNLEITTKAGTGTMLSATDSDRIAKTLSLLRTAPVRLDGADPRIVITSGSLGVIALQDGQFALNFEIQSSSDADRDLLYEKYRFILEAFDLELVASDTYSGWPEQDRSPFRDRFNQVHRHLFGSDLELERIHGGIEVGIIVGAIPDMDAVGIAPTATGAHTPKECLFIDEVAPFWALLKAVLARKD